MTGGGKIGGEKGPLMSENRALLLLSRSILERGEWFFGVPPSLPFLTLPSPLHMRKK